MSMFASVFAAIAILRARSEETSGLAESILATPISRDRYPVGHTAVALVGGALELLAGVRVGSMCRSSACARIHSQADRQSSSGAG